jgi:protein O-GlcNAc transferase
VSELATIRHLLDTQQAEVAYTHILQALEETPEQIDLWHLLGLSLIQLDRHAEARQAFESLLALEPGHAECHFQLGILLQIQGETESALKHLQAARAFCPESENYTQGLAQLYLQLGQRENLMMYAQDSLRHHPHSAGSYYLLGCAFQRYGRFSDAEAALRQALWIQSDHVQASFQLGCLFLELEDTQQAIHWLSQTLTLSASLTLHPAWLARVYTTLGQLLQREGQSGAAADCWQEALKHWPDFQACTGLALQLPEVYAQIEDLPQWRIHFENGLNTLEESFTQFIPLTDTAFEPPYTLRYQGIQDQNLLEKTGRFFQKLLPPHKPRTAPHRRLVILWEHCPLLWQDGALSLLKALSKLEPLTVLSSAQTWVNTLETHAIQAHWLPPERAYYLQALEQLQPDKLLFSDLRTPLSYTLGLERFAPFQGVLCLQPETTGLNRLDAFFSCEQLEPLTAPTEYSERLFRLKEWPILPIVSAPPVPQYRRADLGLPTLGNLYFCPMRIAKIHPDLDSVLQAILDRDRRALIYLLYPPGSAGYTYLQQRFDHTIVRRRNKIRFLPCQTVTDFWAYLHLADLVIDTPWNGGRASVCSALTLGVPVLTWEGPWMRGRWASACNQRLALTQLNAPTLATLADRAIETAANHPWRAILKKELPQQMSHFWNPAVAAAELALSLSQI